MAAWSRDPAGMRVITLLNQCYRFPGFIYENARVCPDSKVIEIDIRPRRGSKPVCSGCHRPGRGYDHLAVRHFEFVPLWGFLVYFVYRIRRVDCNTCGVRVEEIPWASGKHQLTNAYMLFLAHWARMLSWQETANAFRTSWDKVCQAVEYVLGARTPRDRRHPGDRGRRDPVWQGPHLSDPGLPDRAGLH